MSPLDGCRSDTTTIPSRSNDPALELAVLWPETDLGRVSMVACPCGSVSSIVGVSLRATRYCGGNFVSGAQWEEPDVSPCDFSDTARQICQLASVSTWVRNTRFRCAGLN